MQLWQAALATVTPRTARELADAICCSVWKRRVGFSPSGLDFASLEILSSKYSTVVMMGASLCFPAGPVSAALKISHSIAVMVLCNCP